MSLASADITGVIAALRSEARCLASRKHARLMVEASGMGCERAAHSAQRLVRAGARALLCWGVAGALDPSLRCGDIVLASEVMGDSALTLHLESMRPALLPARARLRTSAEWRGQLESVLARQGPLVQGAVLTSSRLVCEVALKARLFRETAAIAVDMESAAVAVVAQLHGLPFMALRVIIDTASEELPGVLQRAGTGWASWLAPAVTPTAWPGLMRLGRRYRVARRVLQHCAGHIGPGSQAPVP